MNFRSASEADLGRVQEIARDTIDVSYRSFIDDDRVDWLVSGPSDEYLRECNDDITLVTEDESIVGFAVCKQDLIDLIVVDHASHGRGYGSALLAHCELEMFERYKVIRLESFEGNARANRFYRKYGWERVRIRADSMSGSNKWVFEKRRQPGP